MNPNFVLLSLVAVAAGVGLFFVLQTMDSEDEGHFVLILEALIEADDANPEATLNRLIEAYQQRFAALELEGIALFIRENQNIEVQVPFDADLGQVKTLLLRPGRLNFHHVVVAGTHPDETLTPNSNAERLARDAEGIPYLLLVVPLLSGNLIEMAEVAEVPSGFSIELHFNNEGATGFAEVVADLNEGDRMAIVLDDLVLTAPSITPSIQQLANDQGTIPTVVVTGQFTEAQANEIILLLNLNVLPVDVVLLSENIVMPETEEAL